MPATSFASTLDHLPSEIVAWLVGHTVEEVERELIVHTLAYHGGSRTRASNVLGISIRTLRNKINEYEALGIAVSVPGDHGFVLQSEAEVQRVFDLWEVRQADPANPLERCGTSQDVP